MHIYRSRLLIYLITFKVSGDQIIQHANCTTNIQGTKDTPPNERNTKIRLSSRETIIALLRAKRPLEPRHPERGALSDGRSPPERRVTPRTPAAYREGALRPQWQRLVQVEGDELVLVLGAGRVVVVADDGDVVHRRRRVVLGAVHVRRRRHRVRGDVPGEGGAAEGRRSALELVADRGRRGEVVEAGYVRLESTEVTSGTRGATKIRDKPVKGLKIVICKTKIHRWGKQNIPNEDSNGFRMNQN